MSQTQYITIKYVNAREGNRPPSIKDENGTYYTVADEAIGQFQQGAGGELGFYVNQRGYSCATHWNGAELPSKDKPGIGHNSQPERQGPLQAAVNKQIAHKDEMIWRTAIAKSCIEAGRSSADADHWWEWLNGRLDPLRAPTDEQAQSLTNEELSNMDHFAH